MLRAYKATAGTLPGGGSEVPAIPRFGSVHAVSHPAEGCNEAALLGEIPDGGTRQRPRPQEQAAW